MFNSKKYLKITAITCTCILASCSSNLAEEASKTANKPEQTNKIKQVISENIYINSVIAVGEKEEKGLLIKYKTIGESSTKKRLIKNATQCKYKTGESVLIAIEKEKGTEYIIRANNSCN